MAVSSGFRNSGLTIGKTGKIITVNPFNIKDISCSLEKIKLILIINAIKTALCIVIIYGVKASMSPSCVLSLQAVRSTHGLEVPLSHAGKLLVEHEYIRFLAQVVNRKMEENLKRIEKSVQPQRFSALTSNTKWHLKFYPLISRFYHSLQSALITGKLEPLQLPYSPEPQASPHRLEMEEARELEETPQEKRTSVYKRRRRRERCQTDYCHGDGPSNVLELDGCLDLFTWSSGSANMLLICSIWWNY